MVVGLGYHSLYLPWTPVALIGTAVAFIIGFQNNSAYGRVWEARIIWGGIVNSSRSWGMKVKDMIRATDSSIADEKLRQVHQTLIYRHLAWLTALRYAMRTERPWEVNFQKKSDKEWSDNIHIPEKEKSLQSAMEQFLSLEEVDHVMSRKNPASAVLFLQSKHIRKLKEQGLLWEFSFLELENLLEKLFDHQGKSERIKNFPYPRQYTSISFLFVRLFILLLPFAIIPEFGKAGLQFFPNQQWPYALFVWLSVPASTITCWVFHTMERIGRVGENPFEGTSNDVPISTISHGIEVDLRQLLNEPVDQLPQPIREDMYVQM